MSFHIKHHDSHIPLSIFYAPLESTLISLAMSGHHHDHDGHCHGEDHDHSNDITPAIQSLLYSQINFDLITTLNGMLYSALGS